MSRPRVLVVGLGDTGVLTAIHLARHDLEVVGVATKPGLVSGQELGLRLADPQRWSEDYWVDFARYRRLDPVRRLAGRAISLDPAARTVTVRTAAGQDLVEAYDALVISTGVSNGFWRRPDLQTREEVDADLAAAHRRLAGAARIAVVGGGAAAVGSAYQLAVRWPASRVDLYFPADRGLTSHHGRVWDDVAGRLAAVGVGLHPGHRAVVPGEPGAPRIGELGAGPVAFSTGQDPVQADVVLWALGRVRPHTDWLPAPMLDERGFVRVGPTLQTPDDPRIFAIGDVAATDPLRSSARNRADRMLARNVRAVLADGPSARLTEFRPARRRWGSVLGYQPDGLRVYAPGGRPFRVPAPAVGGVLRPWVIRRGIYGGIRPEQP